MSARTDIKKILIIGSGPIMIGQACEFDYSGNQAVRALKEEGYQVVLVNPNPATVMTTPGIADAIYCDPLEVPFVEAIIREERPDALLATMGGQTALNLTLALDEAGVLERYGVETIGARSDSIRMAEDRGLFKAAMERIGLESARSAMVASVSDAESFLDEIGIPAIIRPSYTLGGRGGAIANSKEEFRNFVDWALTESPVHTALIEESLLGWREFELEVMRDQADNAVIVCSIENIDPMGVHTGDSITIAPVQTLSDREYQRMRTAAIEILREIGVDCGGSNVQFALDPSGERMIVIEMNPRVSRSSALASKATGFPIARCSAKLAVGYTLDEITNEITGKTVSCFEPSLDYCAVKVPRFELEKFPQGYVELGTQMKSVGEALALGRSFPEALNKAIRAAEFGFSGLESLNDLPQAEIDRMIDTLHPRRIFALYTELCRRGTAAIDELATRSGYHPWFLYEMAALAELEGRIAVTAPSSDGTVGATAGPSGAGAGSGEAAPVQLDSALLLEAKRSGISDKRIAALTGSSEVAVRAGRNATDLHAVYHFVDTCSGEFDAATPYFYGTYGEIDEGTPVGHEGVVILASGPNRIGQGLEFDTCCTLCSLAYRTHGVKTVIINSNPETVSTDFNVSDRLYLEPLTSEDVLEVLHKEGIQRVVVQLGGQTPLNMARELEAAGAEVVGTPTAGIERAENRELFYQVLQELGLKLPVNRMASTAAGVEKAAEEIGYPVLLRPSYVLGGRSMVIAFNRDELHEFLEKRVVVSPESPVLVDQFLEDAYEYDIDAICDGESVYVAGIMQHIEAAGIHSGDSACVFPPYKSAPATLRAMTEATARIALEIGVRGLLNIQFAWKGSDLYVLEVNPRASRTVPFVSKASGIDLIAAAVGIWQGTSLREQELINDDDTGIPGVGLGRCITGWAVKEAMFSFDRFRDVDPLLGPEMRSTGESIGIGADFGEAFAKASLATGTKLPTEGRVFVSVHDSDKSTMLPIVRELRDLGFEIAATRGTADYLFQNGIFSEVVLKVHEGRPNVVDHLQSGRIDLLINTPLGRYTQRDDSLLRIEALRHHVPYTTTSSAAEAAVLGIKYLKRREYTPRRLPEGRVERR